VFRGNKYFAKVKHFVREILYIFTHVLFDFFDDHLLRFVRSGFPEALVLFARYLETPNAKL